MFANIKRKGNVFLNTTIFAPVSKTASMFFILSKLLAFITTPILWLFVLLLLAFFKKDAAVKKKLLVSALLIFFFFSNSFIFDEVVRKWEIPAIKQDQLTVSYDAGIVLGGISVYDPSKDRLQFYSSGDRLFQAIELYKSGKIKKIFFVGGSGSITDADMKEGVYVHAYLTKIGIPESAILIEQESKNTRENAINAKIILDKNFTTGTYLLITSATHMRRASACFAKVGINALPYSTDCMSGPRKFIFDHVFIPDASALWAWNVLIHEWLGYLTYKIAGYI